jgi:tetratricopeptide (TPR) repeat protein
MMRLFALFASWLVLQSAAFAQQGPVDPEVRKHYEEGKKDFRLRDFDGAITEWKAGYKLKADATFLYNIAQAYKEKGDFQTAIAFYQSYLKELPSADNRDTVQKTMDELKAKLAAPPPKPDTNPPPTPPPPRSTETESHTSGVRIAGIVVGVAGLGLVGTGVVFGLGAQSNQSAFDQAKANHDPWTPELQAKVDAGKRDAMLSTVTLIAGSALVVGGVVMIAVGKSTKKAPAESSWRLTPAVGPGVASLAFSAAW